MNMEIPGNSPKVSVIIPVYNGANCLAETIRSVLNQTYPNFELIIVNDGSTDQSSEVVRQFNDPRLKYIEFSDNRGADIARNTAIRASAGEILAFLDQDDIFRPEKLQVHVDYMKEHPDVGFTYNARFELNYSSSTIRDIWQPPNDIELKHILLSHQLSPSDMVIRREWAFKVDLLDETHPFYGGEIIFLGRLYLLGCKFRNVRRILNYRRYYTGRVLSNLYEVHKAEEEAREKILSDPRCPKEVRRLRDIAFANNYLVFAYLAFAQQETSLGQYYLRAAFQLNPRILEGQPCPFMNNLLHNSIADENLDHRTLLKNVLAQLPSEMAWLFRQYDWAVAQGYLYKGARAVMWGRFDDGRAYLAEAASSAAQIDEPFLQALVYQLLNYQVEFGDESTRNVIKDLAPYLKKITDQPMARRLTANYCFNRALQNYHAKNFQRALSDTFLAIRNEPRYLGNRGIVSILFHSIFAEVRC